LRKVGERLIALPNTIEVLGYTDDVPIGRRYPSNWELAAARASSVVRLLAEVGVDPTKLRVVSRGEFAPVAPNDTAEGRALNRRIEIRLASAGSSSADPPDKVEESSAAPPAPPVTQPTIEEPAAASEPAEAAIDESEVEALAPPEAERVSAP
jgi:chemotaxis protein MotB